MAVHKIYVFMITALQQAHTSAVNTEKLSSCFFLNNGQNRQRMKAVTDPQDLQQDLNSLADREQCWKMFFHPKRCTAMNIIQHCMILPSQYQLHGHTLSTEMEAKYLGVKITSDLHWDSHITDEANKTGTTSTIRGWKMQHKRHLYNLCWSMPTLYGIPSQPTTPRHWKRFRGGQQHGWNRTTEDQHVWTPCKKNWTGQP